VSMSPSSRNSASEHPLPAAAPDISASASAARLPGIAVPIRPRSASCSGCRGPRGTADFDLRHLTARRRIRLVPDEGQSGIGIAGEEPDVAARTPIKLSHLCALHVSTHGNGKASRAA
jgi:hypothetical protein